MSSSPDSQWDEVEELVFQCLELQSESGGDADAHIARLLEEQPPELAAQARRVLVEVYSWSEPAPATAGEDLRIPDRLGPYTLGKRLGQGGMGAVYEAVDESLGRRVALKVIRPDLLALGGARERFRREVEAVARLSHAGIVQVYQVGEDGGVPWFAMELVDGVSLAEAIASLRGRDPATLHGNDLQSISRAGLESGSGLGSELSAGWEQVCVRMMRDVADALAHAHGRGILHRDIKPSNIVIDSGGHPRLLDFGLARAEGGSDLTRSGALIGSLPYAPPEQVRGDTGEPEARADVYSLGVTLYEMVTLRSPFLAEVEAVTRRNVEQGIAPAPRTLHRGLSWEVAAVISVAMDRDPNRRYQSMVDFAADLQRILDRRPIVARPPGFWLRLRRSAERHPVVATALIAGLLAIATTVTVYAVGLKEERDRALRAQQETERLRTQDRERSYRAGVQAAALAIRLGQASDARRSLEQCPEELRAFEWFNLMARIDESDQRAKVSETFLRRVVTTKRGLFAGGSDGVVRYLLMGSLESEDFSPASGSTIMDLAVNYAADHVASAHRDHLVRLWDVGSRSLRAEISFDPLYRGRRELNDKLKSAHGVAISNDGTTAYATSAGGAVARIDLALGKLVGGFVLPPVKGGLFAIAVSPRNDMLAVGYDHEILLLSPDGDLKKRLRGHAGFIFSLQFSPEGEYLLSASQDKTARMWRVGDGAAGSVFFGHEGEIHQACFGSKGTVWTVGNDSTLRNWNVSTGRERQRRLGHDTAVYGLSIGRYEGTEYVVTAGWDGTVRKWSEDVGKAQFRIGGPGRTLRQQLVLHENGTRCTLVDDAHGARTFMLPNGEQIESIVDGKIDAVAIQGDDVVAVENGDARRADADEPLLGNEGKLESLTFLADGTLLATEFRGHVVFWAKGDTVGERLPAHEGQVLVAKALPENRGLTAGQDGKVLVWDGRNSRELLAEGTPTTKWDDAAVSPDGKTLYLCGMKLLIAVDLATGALQWQREFGTRLRSVAVASEGRRLLIGGTDRVLRFVDSRDGTEILSLPADNLLHSVVVTEDVAVTSTVYSEIDLWIGR